MPDYQRQRAPERSERYAERYAERAAQRERAAYQQERMPRDTRATMCRPASNAPYVRGVGNGHSEDEPPPTLMGQVRLLQMGFKHINKLIERAFPETPDQIATDLARWTPGVLLVSYLLLAMGIAASRFKLLWGAGYLWGIASLSAIMIGVFLWVWSSNIVRLRNLSAEARMRLRRAMRLQSTTFLAAVVTIVYFVGMAFGAW